MSFQSKWEKMIDLSTAFFLYGVCMVVVIGLLLVFFPLGIVAGIIWIWIVYRYRQRDAVK